MDSLKQCSGIVLVEECLFEVFCPKGYKFMSGDVVAMTES